METCKAQESVKQPLTALQTGEQRNMESQCNAKNKDKTITIPYYTKKHYKSLTKALVKRWVFNAVLKVDKVLQFLMWVGRWFHSLGAQIANERSPKELLILILVPEEDEDLQNDNHYLFCNW